MMLIMCFIMIYGALCLAHFTISFAFWQWVDTKIFSWMVFRFVFLLSVIIAIFWSFSKENQRYVRDNMNIKN
jgi:hypothetical protein